MIALAKDADLKGRVERRRDGVRVPVSVVVEILAGKVEIHEWKFCLIGFHSRGARNDARSGRAAPAGLVE